VITQATGSGSASSAPATSTAAGGRMGKDEFLKLFITQMRNQDPLNPMSSEQLASQMAQFTSVEQLININTQLEQQAALNGQIIGALAGANAVGMLGRTVNAVGNQVAVPDTTGVTATVGGTGGTAVLKIYDEGGKVVGTRELGSVGAGRQTWEVGDAARGLPPGRYRFGIEVVDGEGTPVPVQTFSRGRVEGIRHGPNGPVLVAGSVEIPVVSVVEVSN
jgi:flagellar basal-body rod modification protein FlgD